MPPQLDAGRSNRAHELLGDSSKLKNMQRSPRAQAAAAKAAPRMVLPDPATPEISMLDPR